MILRMLRRLLTAEALGLILVVIALQALTYGIASSLRGTDTKYLAWVCLLAALIGLAFSKRKWNGIQASAAVVAIGVIGVWILGARLSGPLLELFRSIFMLIPQILPGIRERVPMDASLIVEAWSAVLQASSSLFTRWQTWLAGTDKNVTVNDALIRSMVWTLLIWLLAAWTGWFAGKQNAILALLPSVVLMSLVISYSEYRVESLWLMVVVLLLLMGLWNYKNHITQWERHRVDYSDSIRFDNTQAVLFLAVAVGVIAFITPSISWSEIRDYLRERRDSNQAAEMLGIQEQIVPPKTTRIQEPTLPREHLLTEGFAQSQQIVMTIRTGELPPVIGQAMTEDAPRYYWRSTVYDQYMGAGWVTSPAPSQKYKADTPLVPGLLDGYRPVYMDVNILESEGRLFWSGLLYSADIPIRVDWRLKPASNLFASQTELLQADMFDAATGSTSYEAEVHVPVVTLQKLRDASTDYPEELRKRYLALPATLPGRVHQLAQQIVKGIESPYDKAKAIEGYLRTNYPYDLEVPAPPQDRDVADYFLFDLKRGYCDYYATAMVVLARSAGLPARFVSGYSSGSYDAQNARYVVRELNAHSWAEVYFPEIGWVEFEPTGSQPEIERPERETEMITPDKPVTPVSRFLFQLTSERVLYWLSFIGIAILLVVLYYAFFEMIIFMSLAPANAIEVLYRRYYRLGRPLVGLNRRSETAHEFTHRLVQKVRDVDNRQKSLRSSLRLQNNAEQFTTIYYLSLFSDHGMGKSDAKSAFHLWRQIRRSLIAARIKYYFGRAIKRGGQRADGSI